MRRNMRKFIIGCLIILFAAGNAQGQDADKSTAAKTGGGGDLRCCRAKSDGFMYQPAV